MNHNILSRLESILSKIPKGKRISFKEIMENFNSNEELLVEIALTELAERGVIDVKIPKDKQALYEADIVKLEPAKTFKGKGVSKPIESFFEVVLTTPETLRDLLSDFISTKTCFRRLLSSSKRELLVLEPFIDSVILETFEDEFRQIAKNGVHTQIITRKVSKDAASLKAVLRLYELFALNAPKKDLLEIYEYWFPLRYLDDRFRHFIGLHAKMLVQDGTNAYVGSANWTQESLSRNFEVGIFTNDKSLVKSLRKIFQTLMFQSRKLDLVRLYEKSTGRVTKQKTRKR
jgi:phosphatidylserine/phosphatidylglycerophosphate/cardiolipin synthase-like enzyme